MEAEAASDHVDIEHLARRLATILKALHELEATLSGAGDAHMHDEDQIDPIGEDRHNWAEILGRNPGT